MAKYIPFSMVLMTVLLPALLAGRPRVKQSVKSMHLMMAVFILVWAALCLYVYPLHVLIE